MGRLSHTRTLWLGFAVAGALCGCTGQTVPANGGDERRLPDEFAPCTDPQTCCPQGQTVCDDPDEGGACRCLATWVCDEQSDPIRCTIDMPLPPGAASGECVWDEFSYVCTGKLDNGASLPSGEGWECAHEGDDGWRCKASFPPNPSNKPGGAVHYGCEVDKEFEKLECVAKGRSVVDSGQTSSDAGMGGLADALPLEDALPSNEGEECVDGVALTDADGKPFGEDVQLGITLDHPKACMRIKVKQTGYYRLFDASPAESCLSQQDETAYLRVKNSCNEEGWPIDPNLGRRFVVKDADNRPECDGHCEGDLVCREGLGKAGRCCVPERIYVGTFLFVAGEANEMCWHHFCPIWLESGEGDEFVSSAHQCSKNGKGSPQSVHLFLSGVSACLSDVTPEC